MMKISEAVSSLVTANPGLRFGIHHRILNLSQVARLLLPLVEARTSKTVSHQSLLMSLSRFQASLAAAPMPSNMPFRIGNIAIQTELAAMTVPKSRVTNQKLAELITSIQHENGYLTFTEGLTEVTLIIDRSLAAEAQDRLAALPTTLDLEVAALGIKIPEKYNQVPGLLYQLLQPIALQGISVTEVASTRSEFNIYLNDGDIMPAFDAVFKWFSVPDPLA